MEIKEAVGILKSLQEPEAWEPQITEKTFEALDMAIRALNKFQDQSRFITIEYNFQYYIVVDRVTGVMYAVSNGNGNTGTFTPLVNAAGKPLIYEKRMTITESDLVKMGVIDPGEIKAGTVQPPISETYAKAVRNWLVNYQLKCNEMRGSYTPYEVLGWVVSDWRKENGIW